MTDLMSMETTGYNSIAGGWTRTLVLRGCRIRAIDQAIARMDAAHLDASAVQRRLDEARNVVERFDENARAEAIVAGAVGEKFDAAASRDRKAAAVEAVADLELEALAAWSAVDSARSAYLESLRTNVDKLRQSARDEAVLAMQEMTLARESLERAAARLGAALPVLSSAAELVNGMQPTMTAPRTAADNINDAGNPGVHAQGAEAQVDIAMSWLARWLERADLEAEARKAEAKKAKTEAAGGAA